jgi:hypothetical protein
MLFSSEALTVVPVRPLAASEAATAFKIVGWWVASKRQPSCPPSAAHQVALGSLSGSSVRKVMPQVSR